MRILKLLTIIFIILNLFVIFYPFSIKARQTWYCYRIRGCGYWLTKCEAIDPFALVGSWIPLDCRSGCDVDCP